MRLNHIFIVFSICVLICASCIDKKTIRVVESRYPNNKEELVAYYTEDEKHEKVKEEKFHEDGTLLWRGKFANGKRNGYWRSWHKNGNPWSEGKYIDGKCEGKWKVYFENSRLRYEGQYKNGEKKGTWIFYDENGKKVHTEKY